MGKSFAPRSAKPLIFANGAITAAFAYAASSQAANDDDPANTNSPYADTSAPTSGANCSGCYQVAQAEGEDPAEDAEAEARARQEQADRNALDYTPPRDPNKDYPGPTPQQQRDFDALIQNMESIGGGTPNFVPTPKGATQFIFPNGSILRFDIAPGQYSPSQGPHINLQNVPGSSDPNIHIPVKPNG